MNNNRLIVTILILLIVLIGIGWFLSAKGMLPFTNPKSGSDAAPTSNAKASDYTAIFLSNGQVYFGKVDNQTGQYISVNDIYYLQVQQDQAAAGSSTATPAPQQQISLVKLGNELHGPVDQMSINRDHVIFIEKMKSDAKVVTAIAEYKKNGPAPVPSATADPAATISPKK